MDKELEWKKERVGLITASELGGIMSASGKIIDSNLDYVRKKRFERSRRFSLPVNGRALDVGHEQEPYAVRWFKANHPEREIIYSQDCDKIPFWKVDWANFGASPDCFSPDESFVLEIKSVVGNTNLEFFADFYTSYEDKRAYVLKEHGDQLAGQFLSNEKVQEIWLLKYLYQRDEIDEDTDSPLATWRGIIFKFKREEFDLKRYKDRIVLFDTFIDSLYDPKVMKAPGVKMVNGLIELEEEKKK